MAETRSLRIAANDGISLSSENRPKRIDKRVAVLMRVVVSAWSIGGVVWGRTACAEGRAPQSPYQAESPDRHCLPVCRDAARGVPGAFKLMRACAAAFVSDRSGRPETSPPRGIAWLRGAAHRGNAQAQHILGLRYAQGLGVKQNYERANYWFFRAAEQHLAAAENDLGFDYAWGRGMPVNIHMGNEWYRRAAHQGYAPAETNLGFDYANGFGVPVNRGRAIWWWKRAARQGDPDAARDLAALIASGTTGLPGAFPYRARQHPPILLRP